MNKPRSDEISFNDNSNAGIRKDGEIDEESQKSNRSNVREEIVMVHLGAEELENLPESRAKDYEFGRVISFSFWISIANGALFLLAQIGFGVVLKYYPRIETVFKCMMTLPLFFVLTSFIEFKYSPGDSRINPRWKIFLYDLLNRFLYLVTIYVLYKRTSDKWPTYLYFIVAGVQNLSLIVYLCYCFTKWNRSGRSFQLTYPILICFGWVLYSKEYDFESILNDFKNSCTTWYVCLGIEYLMLGFFIIHFHIDTKEKMMKDIERDRRKLTRVDVENIIYSHKVHIKGMIILALLNFLAALSVNWVVVCFHIYSLTNRENRTFFDHNLYIQSGLLLTYLVLCFCTRNTLSQSFYFVGDFNLVNKRKMFKNKVMHRVSSNFFVRSSNESSYNKKKEMVKNFLKDICNPQNEPDDKGQEPAIRDDLFVEKKGERVIGNYPRSRATRRRSSFDSSIFSYNDMVPKNESTKSNAMFKSTLSSNAKKIIDEVKERISKNLSQSKIELINGINQSNECSICMSKKLVTMNEPCWHGVFCLKCAQEAVEMHEIKSEIMKCPLCREIIRKVYLFDDKNKKVDRVEILREITTIRYQKVLEKAVSRNGETVLFSRLTDEEIALRLRSLLREPEEEIYYYEEEDEEEQEQLEEGEEEPQVEEEEEREGSRRAENSGAQDEISIDNNMELGHVNSGRRINNHDGTDPNEEIHKNSSERSSLEGQELKRANLQNEEQINSSLENEDVSQEESPNLHSQKTENVFKKEASEVDLENQSKQGANVYE